MTETTLYEDFAEVEPARHSGLGVASFILCLAIGLLELGTFVTAGIMGSNNPGGVDEESAAAALIGLTVLAGIFGAVVGVGLGIGGLMQRNRKKIFGILGLIMNGMIVLGVGFLIVVGMLLQAAEV